MSEGAINVESVSYHRLFKAYESPNHEQQIHGYCRGERQGETSKGRVHMREDCDECDATNDGVRENVETRRYPSVHCIIERHGHGRLEP